MGVNNIPDGAFEVDKLLIELEELSEGGAVLPKLLIPLLTELIDRTGIYGAVSDKNIMTSREDDVDSVQEIVKRYSKELDAVRREIMEDRANNTEKYSKARRVWAELNVSLALAPSYATSEESARINDLYRIETVINNWEVMQECDKLHMEKYGISFLNSAQFWREPITAIITPPADEVLQVADVEKQREKQHNNNPALKEKSGEAEFSDLGFNLDMMQPSVYLFISNYLYSIGESNALSHSDDVIRFYGRAKSFISTSNKAMNKSEYYVKEAIVSAFMLRELNQRGVRQEESESIRTLNELLLGKIKVARAEIRASIDDIHAHARVLKVGIHSSPEVSDKDSIGKLNDELIKIKEYYDSESKIKSTVKNVLQDDDKVKQELVNNVHKTEIIQHKANAIQMVKVKAGVETAIRLQSFIEQGQSGDKKAEYNATQLLLKFYQSLDNEEIITLLKSETLMPFEKDFLKYVMMVNNAEWKIVKLDEYYLFPKGAISNSDMVGYSGIQFIIEDANGRRSEVQVRSIASDINANTRIGGAARGAYDENKNGSEEENPFLTVDEFADIYKRIATKDLGELG